MADENKREGTDMTPKTDGVKTDPPEATTPDKTSKFAGGSGSQMSLFGDVVGATEAPLPPPEKKAEMTAPMAVAAAEAPSTAEPARWGASDVNAFVGAGGYRLVALKGNVEGRPYDGFELDQLSKSWNIRLESKDNPEKSYNIADLQKLTGDDTLTWNKLLAKRDSDLFLTLPEPAKMTELQMTTPVIPVAKTEGMDNAATAPVPPVAPVVPPVAEGEKGKEKVNDTMAPAPTDGVETEEQRQKKLKDQADEIAKRAKMNTSQPDDMPKQEMPQREMTPEEEMALGKYRAAFHKKGYIELMNGEWGVPDVDDEMKKALGETGEIRKNKKYGLDFLLPNGHKIEWHANMGGAEFIGMTKRTADFDMDDAHAVVATSKSRGWKNLNVHGSVEQKDMMWLEAKRQGLEVANHQPSVNSKYRQMWDQESQANLDGSVIGASPMEHGNPYVPKGGMPQDDSEQDMSPPAQQKKTPMDSPFMKGKGMPTEMTAAQQPAAPVDTIDGFRAFLDREAMAAKDDPAKLAKIQDLKDKLDGKIPAMDKVDADIAMTAEKQGVKIPAIVDGSAKPGKVGEPEKQTPAAMLSFEQQLDREIANEKNTPEVREGLKEMKQAMADKKINADDVKGMSIGMTDGMVARKDFEDIAKSVENQTKFKASPLKDPPPSGNKPKNPVMTNA